MPFILYVSLDSSPHKLSKFYTPVMIWQLVQTSSVKMAQGSGAMFFKIIDLALLAVDNTYFPCPSLPSSLSHLVYD